MSIEEKINKLYEAQAPRYGSMINKTVFTEKEGHSAYGEILQEGVETMLKELEHLFNKDTVFYDLGSGLGKLVYHIGMKVKPKKACGIEFSKERHDYAVGTKEVLDLTDEETHNISFINGNILNQDLTDATVVFSDNTAFPIEISEKIYDKIPEGVWMIFRRAARASGSREKMLSWERIHPVPSSYGGRGIYVKQKPLT